MKLTAIAREDLESKGFICKNEVKLVSTDAMESNCVQDVYTSVIGRKDLKTGELESYWKKDIANNNTEELEKILEKSTTVAEKYRNVINWDTGVERKVIDYYIPYDIQESSKNRPTVTENYIVGCMNGSWACEYELLLTCGDGATRRIVVEYNTVNIGMIEWLSDLEDEIETAMEDDDTDTIFEGIFKKDTEECSITMFDEMGIPCDIPIESVSDFMNMIVSARCIKCDFVDNKKN